MDIDRDDAAKRRARLERMMDEFREAERRSLVKRGITLWNRTERAHRDGSLARRGRPIDKSN